MKKIISFLLATTALLASCSDDDEKIEVKDYEMQTFSADMKYEKPESMAKDFTCKQQTYLKLGKADAVAIGEYGTESWTTFNILPEIPESDKMVTNPDYNVTTKVKNWDLLFTQYVGDAMPGEKVFPYFLAGVLINTASIEIALYKYEESTEKADIAKAFADLKLITVASLSYSPNIDGIGTRWRTMKGMPPVYEVNDNYFFIAKTQSGDYYKIRFLRYYGDTEAEKVFKCEYALLK